MWHFERRREGGRGIGWQGSRQGGREEGREGGGEGEIEERPEDG